ncbi:MAG TPA: LPS assembly protein LptD, partial [Candidatus Limnocylindria bacterium]|nr:LPS assembly protein LptD [Candidatus Limnocylindria bacterium]
MPRGLPVAIAFVLCLVALGLVAAGGPVAHAQQPSRPGSPAAGTSPPDQPVLFKADQVQYDRDLGVIVARGHVEFTQGDYVLRADTVSYNQRADLVTATGHVSLLQPSGDVIFADHAEVTGDLKDGIASDLRMRTIDDTRFAAVGARLSGGDVTEMRKAVYSACEPCKQHPERAPTWQIRAAKVTHNQTDHTIEYEDAVMEMYGIPIAYTPYMSQPDPTVKRKSGFLAPRYGHDSNLGALLEVPYYFAIAPDRDATFSPIFTSDGLPVLDGEYRERFTDGDLKLQGSATRSQDDSGVEKNRGHFFGNLRYDLNDTWRSGAQVQVASDDTYLRRYRFFSEDRLTNHAYVEGFRGLNYATAQAYYWRGLRQNDDPGLTPIVAPKLDYNFVSEPGLAGGRWTMDADMMALTRTDGTDSRRASLVTGWSLPHIARDGEVYRLYATLQTDAYWVNEVQEPGRATDDLSGGVTGRAFPQLGLDWRYPLARTGRSTTQVIEPVVGVVVAPNGGNPPLIPNEDSQDFELDDTNLMSPNRFTGLDRVEGGQRVQYGLKYGLYGPGPAFATAFVGQSYRLRKDSSFPEGSGLEDQLSDVVGRVEVQPNSNFAAV